MAVKLRGSQRVWRKTGRRGRRQTRAYLQPVRHNNVFSPSPSSQAVRTLVSVTWQSSDCILMLKVLPCSSTISAEKQREAHLIKIEASHRTAGWSPKRWRSRRLAKGRGAVRKAEA